MRTQLELGDKDAVFFVCGVPGDFAPFVADARVKVGEELDLVEQGAFRVLLDCRLPDVRTRRTDWRD